MASPRSTKLLQALQPLDEELRGMGFARRGTAWEKPMGDVTWRITIERASIEEPDEVRFSLEAWVAVDAVEREWRAAGIASAPSSARLLDERRSFRFTKWRELDGGAAAEGVVDDFRRVALPWFESLARSDDVIAYCRRRGDASSLILAACAAMCAGQPDLAQDVLHAYPSDAERGIAVPLLRHLRSRLAGAETPSSVTIPGTPAEVVAAMQKRRGYDVKKQADSYTTRFHDRATGTRFDAVVTGDGSGSRVTVALPASCLRYFAVQADEEVAALDGTGVLAAWDSARDVGVVPAGMFAADLAPTALFYDYTRRRGVVQRGLGKQILRADLEFCAEPGADRVHLRAEVFPVDRGFAWPDGVDELALVHQRKTLMSYLTLGLYGVIDTVAVDAAAAADALAPMVQVRTVKGLTLRTVAFDDLPAAIKAVRALPRRPASTVIDPDRCAEAAPHR